MWVYFSGQRAGLRCLGAQKLVLSRVQNARNNDMNDRNIWVINLKHGRCMVDVIVRAVRDGASEIFELDRPECLDIVPCVISVSLS